jgi:hypothetical protein
MSSYEAMAFELIFDPPKWRIGGRPAGISLGAAHMAKPNGRFAVDGLGDCLSHKHKAITFCSIIATNSRSVYVAKLFHHGYSRPKDSMGLRLTRRGG